MYLLLLLLSFLCTNGTMFYILFHHRNDRKSSVSLHASIDNRSHATFALGHFIGGLAFLYFAYRFFYIDNGSLLLLVLSCFGVLAEQVQAFIPHKLGLARIHSVSAAFMAIFISLIIFTAPFIINLEPKWLAAYKGLIALLCASGIRAIKNKPKFYQTQMLFFFAFYPFLLMLVYRS